MIIKTVFDIQTHQPVYAICDAQHQCGMITTNMMYAIKAGQCKNFDQVKEFINRISN
jgi:hypothetical protein